MFPTGLIQTVEQGAARVQSAIANAASRTGVDFSYLFQQAKIESGLNPTAKAKTSSATGLFQFIDQSWLGVVKNHGADNGLSWAANCIRKDASGHYCVDDPQTRQSILALRNDPDTSATMAAEHAADNKTILETRLNRPVEPVDLYLAHFLGVGGATKFLKGLDANPNAAAAAILPGAARANHGVFYNRDGSARSFADIRARFQAKLNGTTPAQPTGPATTPVSTNMRMASAPAASVGPSPAYARLAYLMLANLGG